MVDSIKNFFVNMLTGASAFTAAALIGVGFSDHLHPDDYPMMACLGLAFPFFLVANLIMFALMIIVRWKRCWVPLLGFVFAYVPIRTYIPLHPSSAVPDSCLTIVSYNVAGYGGNYRYEKGVDTVVNYLRRINADIVCLQEDHGGKSESPVDSLKKLYPYNDTVHVEDPLNALINAVGIHTRLPILRKQRIDYGSLANGTAVFYLQMDNGDTLIVINNHLESTHLSPTDRERYKQALRGDMEQDEAKEEALVLLEKMSEAMVKRAAQADSLHRFIAEHAGKPIIVCGDFNDTPISYVRHTVAQGLTDCFVESGCGLGLSFNQNGFNFRIDHIMCSDHFIPYNCRVDSRMNASDHYPIMCWLQPRNTTIKP